MSHTDFAAGVIIFRSMPGGQRHYLILKSASGYWELPKGHLESGERWLAAAQREAKEETGLTEIQLVRGFARQIQYVFLDRQKRMVRKTVCFALGKVDHSSVQLSDEHTDFAFLPFQEAVACLTHPATRQLLRDADAYMQNYM
jgi:bis(5'-nucleosidyl)-tetraphosphatase